MWLELGLDICGDKHTHRPPVCGVIDTKWGLIWLGLDRRGHTRTPPPVCGVIDTNWA